MNKSFINGYEKIENDFGYFPSFHDDTIDKIEISSKAAISAKAFSSILNFLDLHY